MERKVTENRSADQTIDAQLWTDLVEGSASIVARGGVDIDALLREIGALESLLAGTHSE